MESPGGEWDRMSRTATSRVPGPPIRYGNPATGIPFCKPGVISGAAMGITLATG